MYMDNVLSGVSDDEDVEHYYRHSRQLLASAGMNLRQWTTNSSKLKENLVAENTIATDKPNLSGPGVGFKCRHDQFPFNESRIRG